MPSSPATVTALAPFGHADLSVVNSALSLIPELQLAAHLLREARKLGLTYPVAEVSDLHPLIPQGSVHAVGHIVNAAEVDHYFPTAFMPIVDDDDFLRKVYMTLQRCRHEAAAALQEGESNE
jgi:hypothetical protein